MQRKVSFISYILIICSLAIICLSLPAVGISEEYIFSEDRLELPNFPALDETKLELFVDSSNVLYALNLRANLLYIIDKDRQTETMRSVSLNFPSDKLTREANLWVGKDYIYIKVYDEPIIWRFDKQGKLINKFELKNRNLSNRSFIDFAVDPRGYIYAAEETTGKVEVFNPEGTYKGQLAKIGGRFFDLRGLPQSLFIDNEGYIYVSTIIPGENSGEIVKYSYQGLVEQRYSEVTPSLYPTIYVDKIGNVFGVDRAKASVVKFDRRGRLICRFRVNSIRMLAVDRGGKVYVDNGQGGALTTMIPSETERLVDRGTEAFLDKEWAKAEYYYRKALLRDNEMEFIHLALGEVYYNQQYWFKAMHEFKYIKDDWRYSQTLSEFRLFVILNYWPFFIFGLGILIWLGFEANRLLRRISNNPFLSPLMVIWSPLQTFRNQKSNKLQAFVVIVSFSVIEYLSWYFTNPIFIGERQVFSQQIFLWRLFTVIFLTFLWSWVTYKIGELFGGMAKSIPSILSSTALCLVPLIIFSPVLACASHLLTYDELWIY
ncbi:MAG TPA: hypothetical protein VHO90_05105, partial [Bacteroidales bacterium]|nr:hypothetical protein [Bacteroidales bacterium]